MIDRYLFYHGLNRGIAISNRINYLHFYYIRKLNLIQDIQHIRIFYLVALRKDGHIMSVSIIPPLVSSVTFQNISSKAKAPSRFIVHLSDNPINPVYFMVQQGMNKKLACYRDSQTGLFVTDESIALNSDNDEIGQTVISQLHFELIKCVDEEIKNLINALKKEQSDNPKEFAHEYKSIDIIEQELRSQLTETYSFMPDIYRRLRALPTRKMPTLNQYILYDNSNAAKFQVTNKLPFENPSSKKLTPEQKDLVEDFLSVFFDAYNMQIFSWMMGTVFLNKRIHDENISRFFLLYSEAGGVGKSTIMKLIIDGLCDSVYATLVSEFDRYFLLGDRFGSSDMPQNRLVVYDEAVFNGPIDKENMHNFHGLNEASLKTFATTGQLLLEKKFQSPKLTKFNNIHVILTNFLPVVPENRPDLGRRFLPCMLKPTRMQEKAKQLNNMTVAQMIEYVHEHGQAFLNYFAHAYMSNPNRYTNYMYSHIETKTEEDNLNKQQQELSKYDGFKLILQIGKMINIDYTPFIADIKKYSPTVKYVQESTADVVSYTDKRQPNIHYAINKNTGEMVIYLNSAKSFMETLPKGLEFKRLLQSQKTTIKKFTQRVFEFKLKEKMKIN